MNLSNKEIAKRLAAISLNYPVTPGYNTLLDDIDSQVERDYWCLANVEIFKQENFVIRCKPCRQAIEALSEKFRKAKPMGVPKVKKLPALPPREPVARLLNRYKNDPEMLAGLNLLVEQTV